VVELAPIPQVRPLQGYQTYRDEINAAIERVLSRGQYILGEEVNAFETEFAAYVGVRYGSGVGSGSEALHVALWACQVCSGDEVITVSHRAVATVAAIRLCGAVPIFVDIEPCTMTMDPSRLEAAITGRTRAIIPVHLYGHPADLEPILAIADRYGLYVIEDCAQSHGAKYKGQNTGSVGHLGCFSLSGSIMVLTHPSTRSLPAPAPASEAGALAHAATAPAKIVTGVWPRRRYP
jgi:dTDP-4-amino-4,6-dideoxygalactose transaminase